MPLSMLDAKPSRDIPQGTGLDPGSRLAFLPCAQSIFAPDGYLREPDALAPCMEAVELEFVHGYRAHDCRDNLFYSAKGEVVYHTAAIGIVYNRESNTQNFLVDNPTAEGTTGHTDDILCLARHPNGNIYASGEVGRNPKRHRVDDGRPSEAARGAAGLFEESDRELHVFARRDADLRRRRGFASLARDLPLANRADADVVERQRGEDRLRRVVAVSRLRRDVRGEAPDVLEHAAVRAAQGAVQPQREDSDDAVLVLSRPGHDRGRHAGRESVLVQRVSARDEHAKVPSSHARCARDARRRRLRR